MPALSFSFAPQRLPSVFIAAVRLEKNSRNTCPKINSSVNNAIANEKIIPPTTAMKVIAICITPPYPKFSALGGISPQPQPSKSKRWTKLSWLKQRP
ncbi:MAG: hypothetical protein WBV55_09310 [Candidatus Sulfotelmatobacter sp.]